ncbi:MAG: polysaccharide deacetylase family protein [Negativicutes bacterium]|nr:polysaccharide deacetylase family protein [Negativicutes bacterium]
MSDNAKVVRKIPTAHKVVAITIDDGPHPKTTPQILAVLKAKQVKATFFVLGEKVERFPEILSQEVAAGHEIGSHAYSHAHLSEIRKDKIDPELEKAEEVISRVAPRPTLFRPPGGLYNHTVLEIAGRHHYTMILWSIDTKDWSAPPVEKVVDAVLDNIRPGSIVLFHDGNYPLPTPKALEIIIDRLKEQGYEFITISELLELYEIRPTFSLD